MWGRLLLFTGVAFYNSLLDRFTFWRIYGHSVPPLPVESFVPQDVFYHLNCGDGSLVMDVCMRSKLKKCVGIESDKDLYNFASRALVEYKLTVPEPLGAIEYRNQSVPVADFSDATIIYVDKSKLDLATLRDFERKIKPYMKIYGPNEKP